MGLKGHRCVITGCDCAYAFLLQIQAAVAEYERALLGERFRRGKQQRARAGQVLSHKPPYGYRYVARRENAPGHLVVEESEAAPKLSENGR